MSCGNVGEGLGLTDRVSLLPARACRSLMGVMVIFNFEVSEISENSSLIQNMLIQVLGEDPMLGMQVCAIPFNVRF